jgi:tRNA A58 N-methylase Trm61
MTYDFSQHRRVLDLGGGTGSFLVALLRRYQNLEATLFEVPDVAAIARERLASDPLTKQMNPSAAGKENGKGNELGSTDQVVEDCESRSSCKAIGGTTYCIVWLRSRLDHIRKSG